MFYWNLFFFIECWSGIGHKLNNIICALSLSCLLFFCFIWVKCTFKGFFANLFTTISTFVYSMTFDFWPLTLQNQSGPSPHLCQHSHFMPSLIKINSINSLISEVKRLIYTLLPIVTLTFDLWPQKSIGFIPSSWLLFKAILQW